MTYRKREPGEIISVGDVLLIGGTGYSVFEQPWLHGRVVTSAMVPVMTTDPLRERVELFPAKPQRPSCACGEIAEYDNDGTYLCRGHFDEQREQANG